MYYYLSEEMDFQKRLEVLNLSEVALEKLKHKNYVQIEDLVDRRLDYILPALKECSYKVMHEVLEKMIEGGFIKDHSQEEGRVEAFGFDVRITNLLRRAEIYTVEELVEVYNTPGRLSRVRKLGEIGIDVIEQSLIKTGYIKK